MPHNIAVKLHLPEDYREPANVGQQLHGLFFYLLDLVDPVLSKKLHDNDGPAGFSLSGIQRLKLNGKICNWFRISTADDHLGRVANDSINQVVSSAQELQLGQTGNVLLETFTSGDFSPHLSTHYLSYEELIQQAAHNEAIVLEFKTPTAFNISGKAKTLPDPSLCFKHYLRQWTTFDPGRFQQQEIKDLVNKFKNNIRVAEYSSQSRASCMKGYLQHGFVGAAIFELFELDDETIHNINALADFSFYCGTGYKTTMGMGQTFRRHLDRFS